MYAWSFSVQSFDELGRVIRALGKHRYVREVDHRLHFAVDEALAPLDRFAPHHAAFVSRVASEPDLDPSSRDPSLFRKASVDDVLAALEVFWTREGPEQERARNRLDLAIAKTGLPPSSHAPFACPPDDPPHPELVMLDWVLLPVDELDVERHAGALKALEDSGDEVNPSQPIHHEGPILAVPELVRGSIDGDGGHELFIWADGPYSYSDYVFRGVARAAKLGEPPVGYRDF